ncbi:hypothetical protein RDWZM_003672 [Blomia tropicalis]|uniref:RRM domain-containing protein n=1 Tax=Blomia tropicalis TaxID=40697 RepID=A0A9Q0MG98_BLOTA|nr:hypothetical protein RDWZM_003672 [Blomia tropicalis]
MNKDVRTKLSIQNQSPANKDGMDNERKNKNMNDHNKSNNLMKKRKMNHNGGPQNASGNTNGGGGNNSNNNWNGGPPGNPNQMPYNAHRLTGAPAWDLPPGNSSTQTFTGRCRLFVANLPASVTDESLGKLFSEFGQLSEIYIGKGNQFAFVKMDTRQNAENAKNALDGKLLEGRTLRVRLAAHAAAIKVTNLPPCASNELLFHAFSTFGTVERAIVIADDRGRSTNEGIVEFGRKSSAQAAIKKCQQECLLLSSTPIPVVVTSLESRDEEEGVPEKNVQHTIEYRNEREYGPRFAEPGSVEFEVSNKWKQLSQIEAKRREEFEAEMREMHENFKNQMEFIKLEETTKQLREQLRQMEAQSQKMNADREARYDIERQREEQRRQHENMLRAQEEQIISPHGPQTDLNALRRQESDLRQQANALQQMLDRQESSLRQMSVGNTHHDDRMNMNSNMYGQPGMAGPNHGGLMGPGPAHNQMPPSPVNQMPMNPYGAPPNGPGTMHGGPQQHGQMGPHHPHPMQPQHQPMMPYNGVPSHTISMPPQSYNSGPSPQMGNNGYQLPKRNRRF